MCSYRQLQPRRLCPVCEHEQVNFLYGQILATLSSGSLLNGYDVVTCMNCGFGFADHIPLQSEFDRYYRNMSKYEFADSNGKESPYDASRFDEIANFITPYIQNHQASVLDIGCATGGLLYRVKLKGFENVTGLDPSPACASLAWSQYRIRVLTGSIAELNETHDKYDFVILIGVLEHLRDLNSHVQVLKKILTENGRLFIEVPDALSFDQWPDAPYQQFSMEHVNFFSPTSLQNLMLKSGFRTIHVEELAREQSHSTMMPVVAAVFEQTAHTESAIQKCEETDSSLMRYIRYSEAVQSRVQQLIADLADSQKPVLVWGTGTHTLHLMETSDLPRVKIIAFIDSNPHYQNKEIKGVPVIAPIELRKYVQPIFISSRVFQNDIVDQIRRVIGAPNEIILLYDEV